MNTDEALRTKIVKMQISDIKPVLDISAEAALETWRYDDFVSEIRRPDSIVLVGKIKKTIVGFCVARLIISGNGENYNDNNFSNCSINDNFNNNSNIEEIFLDLTRPDSIISQRNRCPQNECEIYNIAVRREFWRRGIGRDLLNQVVRSAKRYSCRSLWLEVRNSNGKAISFYKKNDFSQIYKRKNFYSKPPEDAIVMKRNLQTDFFGSTN